MHNGARFHRCDFQVHTPRDRNWAGARATTEDERRAWAASLVAASRKAGLDAIAITDHHDLVIYPYVRAAAAAETDGTGHVLSPERRLTTFPGIEVTLGLPCQVIVLFDADIPLEFLEHVSGALGYAQAAASDHQTAQTEKLSLAHPNEVIERLESLSYLRGKFIVLPHVGENRHQTLIRRGFDAHYKEFRGVGAYVDGAVPDLSTGARNILDGGDPNYGNKPLAIIQTSDSRRADFRDLGKHSTWIKWSRPSAEALRQSCLARQSRISQVPPQLPAIAITRVEVSASKFLGKQNIYLSPEFNAIIGGRGTGKSTLLEYMRWALCVPVSAAGRDGEVIPEYERRSRALIERTLADVKGAVRVDIDVRGVPHVVERRTATADAPLVIKVGDSEFRATDEDEVRRLMPVEAYSQKQLSSIGGSAADVLRFVLTPVSRDVSLLDDALSRAADLIRESFVRARTTERATHEVGTLRSERESLVKQREALQQQYAALDPKDAAVLKSADAYSAERSTRDRWRRELGEAREAVATAQQVLARLPSPMPSEATPDAALVQKMHDAIATFIAGGRVALDELGTSFDSAPSLRHFHEADEQIETKLVAAREQFKLARERAQAHETAIKQVETISKRIADLDTRLGALERNVEAAEAARAAFADATAQWGRLLGERSALTARRCVSIEAHSQKMVRGQVRAAADLSVPLGVLAEVATGSRLRAVRFDGLGEYLLGQPSPFTVWTQAVDEMRQLIGVRAEDATLAPCPVLHAAGFADKDLRALATKLDDETWLRIRLARPADGVTFEYRAREGEYIPFAEASAGQRATALMRVLLADEGVPLLIDQPEDDLDNKIIHEIASDIWHAKSRRQLVFASHNANLVVNGDADLVVVFDYSVGGEHTSGIVRAEGAIDDDSVRAAIAEVMEGGREAFQLRRDKYDF